MPSVQVHYDRLLSKHYTWMFGDFEARLSDHTRFFERLGMRPGGGGAALDLGAGSGFQSIPLARRGYRVKAIDTCAALLEELATKAGGLPIECVVGDIQNVANLVERQVELAVCMGDTLTHLPSAESVRRLFEEVYSLLESGGDLVLTWRDLSVELSSTARFIPVRADDTRILTCFLEYFPEHVMVYDLVHTRDGGAWKQEVSSYRKLRLSVAFVVAALETAGFVTALDERVYGMETVVARKPRS